MAGAILTAGDARGGLNPMFFNRDRVVSATERQMSSVDEFRELQGLMS